MADKLPPQIRFTDNTTGSMLIAPAFLPLVEQVRLNRVNGQTLDPASVRLAPVPDDPGSLVIDSNNGLVDVDARLSLAQIAARLAPRGWLLPLLRPLPATPLWRLAMAAPVVVDAVVQAAIVMTVDGDLFPTPRAPRHSAGPSVLHAATLNPPLGFLTRARLRIAPMAQTLLTREDHADVAAVARRLRALLDDARGFGVDAFGTSLVLLGAPPRDGANAPGLNDGSNRGPSAGFKPWTTARARWSSARSISGGDVEVMAGALATGKRVILLPYLHRAAVLERARPRVVVSDVRSAAASLAEALRGARLPSEGSQLPGARSLLPQRGLR